MMDGDALAQLRASAQQRIGQHMATAQEHLTEASRLEGEVRLLDRLLAHLTVEDAEEPGDSSIGT